MNNTGRDSENYIDCANLSLKYVKFSNFVLIKHAWLNAVSLHYNSLILKYLFCD